MLEKGNTPKLGSKKYNDKMAVNEGIFSGYIPT